MSSLPMPLQSTCRAPRTAIPASAGFGLVELMIGLVIGSVLLLGLGQVFSTSRTAYQTSEGLARAQENSRFAMDFLQRDLRMAGHMGCVNDVSHFQASPPEFFSHFLQHADRIPNPPTWGNAPYGLQFDTPIQGYEANNSAPTNNLDISANTDPVPTAGTWSPALPPGLAGKVVPGSDVVMLRIFDSSAIPVTNINLLVSPVQITVPPAYASQIKAGNLFGLGDCIKASVFAATTGANVAGTFTVNAGVLPNRSDFEGGEGYVAKNLLLYPLHSVAYYIGRSANGGPALYRLNYSNGVANGAPEELVEGIENMQFLYGYDSQPGAPDGAINSYWTASTVQASALGWRRVDTVRVGFISRSVDRAAVAAGSAKPNVLGVAVTPPAGDDRLREVYTSTVALRNRLFGN